MIRTKMLAGLAAGAVVLTGAASVASAQDDPYTPPETTVPTVPSVDVKQGETITLTGTKCQDGDTATVKFDDGTTLGTGTANPFGGFGVTITVPASAAIAKHTVTATCAGAAGASAFAPGGGNFGRAVTAGSTATVNRFAQTPAEYKMVAVADRKNEIILNVLAGATTVTTAASGTSGTTSTGTSGNSALARTGSDVLPLVGIAGAALLLGGAFVYGARKPRQA